MHNHAPLDYICPICLGIQGEYNSNTLIRDDDIIYKDKLITAFIASYFLKGNEGHVIVVPNEHIENIYDMSEHLLSPILFVAQKMAIAMKKSYKCDGITFLQNNEPASNQHAFHYHLHIFPRYDGDDFQTQQTDKQTADPSERLRYAHLIKSAL